MGNVQRQLTVGLVYAVLATAGLALAIPPGYASPVFPAAGFAIAAALRFGNPVLPGVWLGSLAANALVAWHNGGFDTHGLTIAAALASGALLQTWAARRMVLRWCGDTWQRLESETGIIKFLAISAPLACLISATAGISTLTAAGIIPPQEALYSWWSWWSGDTLGVLIFTPLTLIFLLRADSPWRERQAAVAVPMILTLCLVVPLYLWVVRWERAELLDHITDYGNKIAKELDRRLVAHQEALSSLSRLIEVTPDMTFQQFEHFTRITLTDNRDIFALSYNHFISDRGRRSFEHTMTAKSPVPGYRITERNRDRQLVPAAERPYYVAVSFIAPLEGNLPAIGFDINSEPIRRDAVNRAIRSRTPAVTAPIQLVQEHRQRTGVLVLCPAYHRRALPAGTGDPVLAGFAVGVIKVDELVQIALRNELQNDIVFTLSDPLAERSRRTLFQSGKDDDSRATTFAWRTSLTIADRQWLLEVYPTAGYLQAHRSWLSWVIGIAGLLFAALLQILMLAMTGRASVIRRQVAEQTGEITRAKVAAEASERQLEELNRSLQQRVHETVAELRNKDQMLISQGRQAAMGEMIGNIAHQWRQPLNALSMVFGNIQSAYQHGELDDAYLAKAAANANRLIQKMSTTITDFRNFFRPEKEMVSFSALEQVRQSVELIEAAFNNNNIAIAIEACDDFSLFGYPNEYSQVLLNLMSNARDAIVATNSLPGRITISLSRDMDGMGAVSLRDNGGGIPGEILDKIFEPYFSTKKMGTGIGLYMSKTIIERNMNGSIRVQNYDEGCEFTVRSPLAGTMKQPEPGGAGLSHHRNLA